MGTSILERGISLPKISQLAGAQSGGPAHGLYPALLSNCQSSAPRVGPNPGVTLLTPASTLFLFARTDTG